MKKLLAQGAAAVVAVVLLVHPVPIVAGETARSVVLPLERTAYFVGEQVPMAFAGFEAGANVKLELVGTDGRVQAYAGKAVPILLDTAKLSPGDYRLEVDGKVVLLRLTVVATLRKSEASMQDEANPRQPQLPSGKKFSPQERAAFDAKHWDGIVETLRESGISAVMAMGAGDVGQLKDIDALARAGVIVMPNPDTRPTSFNPTTLAPEELASMSQRMILAAQANGRFPNFGGFCYGWDTTGFAIGSRRSLLVYWGWGANDKALRTYINRIDGEVVDIFRKRTGMEPVTEGEYISYLLSIRRPEFATMIDLPSKTWLEAIAKHTKPMTDEERGRFEKRLDVWSGYLMGMYGEVYGTFSKNLKAVSPSMRHTASVQVDHQAVRNGQYFPSAYSPLDLQYQSTWNDQVGGPDYVYQWLLTAGLLQMHRGDKPTWLSNGIAQAHHRAGYPGKFPRVAGHGLAYGVSGLGFALEGFSNLLGGMNRDTNWENIKGKSGQADVDAGREFLDRFVALALNARGDHGVGLLFSKGQFQRQHVTMGFGQGHYKTFVALTRLGYTPRFVTEEDLIAGRASDFKTLMVVGQTFPLPAETIAAIDRFAKAGGRVMCDANTTIELPKAERFPIDLPFTALGKPFNWGAPNMPRGDNDTRMFARWYADNASKLAKALGDTGRGLLTSSSGADSSISLLQIDAGKDARYVVAVNDSHVATQADWFQVREKLLPTATTSATIYDLTEEKNLGKLGPIDCDLSMSTVRVYGVLSRPLGRVNVSALQKLQAGQDLTIAVRLDAADQKPLHAVVPLHISLLGPDGSVRKEIYRGTDREGTLAFAIPMPVNVPAGVWQVKVRCQLDGSVATVPIDVTAGSTSFAVAMAAPVIVQGRSAIDPLLAKGQKVVLPIFKSPRMAAHEEAAKKVQAVLAARGVEVEIRVEPEMTTYTLGYDPEEELKSENARADRGETIGKIKRTTTNHNDWFATLSGWRFGRPVILLDLAGVTGDNPLAESLAQAGLLWPNVDAAFPGAGRAVVHGVHWAFAPGTNAIVIRSADDAGLLAGAKALANLPEDTLSAGVDVARAKLWQQRHVGTAPSRPKIDGLTSTGLKSSQASVPFRIDFPKERPPTAEEAKALIPVPKLNLPVTLPVTIDPKKQLVPFVYDGDKLVEASAVAFLVSDLRFSHALQILADSPQAGKTKITVVGLFRTSDRQPMWAAQWEDVLKLYDRIVPKDRKPIEIDVLVAGKRVGTLRATKTETKDVSLEMSPSHGSKEVRKAKEEVVTEIGGEVELPAGRIEILLVHRNIVDGMIDRIGVGMDPEPLPVPAKK